VSGDDLFDRQTEPKGDPNARTLALSDGVVAVAITLLVLDIHLPEAFENWSDAQLWTALVALWPRFLAYLLSFFVIGNLWNSHRAKFSAIVKSDSGLIWINMLFLLTIGLLPFTTDLIAEGGGTLTTAVYAASMVVSGLSLLWLWAHARRNDLVAPTVTAEDSRRQYSSVIVMVAVFAISIPLSVAHADLAKYFWILILPGNFIARMLAVQRWKQAHPGEPVPRRAGKSRPAAPGKD
jgi:uncharacterized membrane protein